VNLGSLISHSEIAAWICWVFELRLQGVGTAAVVVTLQLHAADDMACLVAQPHTQRQQITKPNAQISLAATTQHEDEAGLPQL